MPYGDIYTPINYYSARALMRLFDACYKMGVEDAIEVGDEAQCMEFCAKMYAPMKFGRITKDFTYTWREWKFRLSQMLHEGTMYARKGLEFFNCVGSYGNYLSCVFPIAMDFYMRGIKDYCKHPNPSKWVMFNSKGFMLWKDKPIKRPMEDFVRMCTEFCYDRMHLDMEWVEVYKAEKAKLRGTAGRKPKDLNVENLAKPLSRVAYENFNKMIWDFTRVKEYKTRGK